MLPGAARRRLDTGDAVAGVGMIGQDLRPGMRCPGNPLQDRAERKRIAVDLLHQRHAVGVGRGLDLAGIARLQDALGREHDGAAADEISERMPNMRREDRRLQHDRVPSRCATCPISWR